jgi:hypothetical protein
MKEFFNVASAYKFEWGDLQALFTLINLVLIMIIGLKAAWFGLAVALANTIYVLARARRINTLIGALTMIVMNIYFLTL